MGGIAEGVTSYEGFAWAFQVASAVAAWSTLVILAPGNGLRFSNGGVLALFWVTVYLLWPSYALLMGNEYLTSIMQYDRRVAEIFIFHGQFFLGFGVPLAVLNSRIPVISVCIEKEWLGYGRLILGASLIPICFEIFVRVMSGGGLLPNLDYGQSWTNTVDHYANAAASGGAVRVLAQLQSKLWFLLLIVQGVGVGFLLAESFDRPSRRTINLLLIASFVLLLLTFGGGGRSAVLMVGILGMYICDRVSRPLQWRHIALVACIAVTVFEFYGYFRANRISGFRSAVTDSFTSLKFEEGRFGEFLFMLAKEERGLDIYQNSSEPLDYLVMSATNFVPAQIAPWKLQFESTANALSFSFLGNESIALGTGVAGAIIVDGYRFGGFYGNALLAALFALIYGGVQWWETREYRKGAGYISFYRLMLCGGFAVASFNVVRADLAQTIAFLVYYLISPHLVIWLFYRGILRRSRVKIAAVT